MTIELTVRGSYSAFQPPERGTIRATVALEGPRPQPVYELLTRSVDAVTTSLTPLHDGTSGPVTWWSTQQVRTWAQRPWNKDGVQLPLVHYASASFQAKFLDFTELSRWVGHHVEHTSGFRLDGVTWALTEKRRQELQRQTRARAVRDAAARAQDYADALDLGQVRPVAIADAGMLAEGIGPVTADATAYARAGAGAAASDLALAPEDIEVAAAVDARFAVG